MTIKKDQQIEVEITGIAFGGKGVVRVNGMAVFVEQAVPGDKALIRIIRKKKKYAEARVLQLIEPSPQRINPPCTYSGFCGGCKCPLVRPLRRARSPL